MQGFAFLRRAALLVAAIGLLGPLAAVQAHEFKLGAIEIGHPWSRATPPGARTGAGYLTLKNEGSEADRLVSLSSPRAETVEIHDMSIVDGVMQMRPVKGGLALPAGGSAELSPGGYHMMLTGLTEPFREGEMVPVTLTFEKAGSVEVQLAVGPIGARTPAAEAGHGGAHAH